MATAYGLRACVLPLSMADWMLLSRRWLIGSTRVPTDYMKHFTGVSSPVKEPDIQDWADWAMALPAHLDKSGMLEQAYRVRDWLNRFDDAAQRTLVRSLRRMLGGSPGAWPPAQVTAAV